MLTSELIELLRRVHDYNVCVRVGYNKYEIGNNINFDKKRGLVIIDLDIDDINNEIGLE